MRSGVGLNGSVPGRQLLYSYISLWIQESKIYNEIQLASVSPCFYYITSLTRKFLSQQITAELLLKVSLKVIKQTQ